MTNPKEAPREALPEPLKAVAWLTSWPKDRVRPAGSIVSRLEPQQKFDCNKYDPLVRLTDAQSALESERQAHAAEVERLRGAAGPRNEWKEAVLDALAAWPGMDFAQDTPPRKIVEAILKIEREAAVTLIPEAVTASPIFTEEQCIDLFAAALYISARGDETSVLSEENAERIAEFLCDLSGVDLTAAIARGTP